MMARTPKGVTFAKEVESTRESSFPSSNKRSHYGTLPELPICDELEDASDRTLFLRSKLENLTNVSHAMAADNVAACEDVREVLQVASEKLQHSDEAMALLDQERRRLFESGKEWFLRDDGMSEILKHMENHADDPKGGKVFSQTESVLQEIAQDNILRAERIVVNRWLARLASYDVSEASDLTRNNESTDKQLVGRHQNEVPTESISATSPQIPSTSTTSNKGLNFKRMTSVMPKSQRPALQLAEILPPLRVQTVIASDKPGKRIPQSASNILHNWLYVNWHNPYPSDRDKEALAILCGISVEKLSTWFVNKRQRLWKNHRTKAPSPSQAQLGDAANDVDDGQLRVLYSCSMPHDKSQMKAILNAVNQYSGLGGAPFPPTKANTENW